MTEDEFKARMQELDKNIEKIKQTLEVQIFIMMTELKEKIIKEQDEHIR